jgi:hypothetical protein
LRAALEWSHGLLGPGQQAVLRRLAVFVGSASLEMLRQVAADASLDTWAVVDALGDLVDRSFVAVTVDARGATRYRLLDTPHAFALERLVESGELDAVRARHARAVRERMDRAQEERWSGRVGADAWRADLQVDVDNARAAFAWARENDPACAVALFAGVLSLLPEAVGGDREDLWAATEPLLTDDLPPGLRARARLEASEALSRTRYKRACANAEQAVALFRAADDPFMLYRALARLARLLAPEDAAAGRQALAAMRELEDPAWPAVRLLCGAGAEQACASWFHDPDRARDWSYRLIGLERDAGSSEMHGLLCVVDIELELKHAPEAQRAGLELIAKLEGSRYRGRLNMAQGNLVQAWLAGDEPAKARPLAQAAWPDAARFAGQPMWGDALALLAAMEGRPRASALLRGYADARYAATQHTRQVAEGHTADRAEQLARAALPPGDFERLRTEGAALRDAQIEAIAFGERDLEAA